MTDVLILTSDCSDLASLPLVGAALYLSRKGARLRQFEWAVYLFMLAALMQFISAFCDLILVDVEGLAQLGASVLGLIGAVVLITLTVHRADRMEAAR